MKVSNKVRHYEINNSNSPYRMMRPPEDTGPVCYEEPVSKNRNLKWGRKV